jgi:hypothetical protein
MSLLPAHFRPSADRPRRSLDRQGAHLANETLVVGKGTLVAAGALIAALSVPALAQQKSIKIGFVSTFGGPPAVIGNDMRNSFELALDLKS